MSLYASTSWTLAAMVAAFVLSSWRFKSPELAMVITALVGAVVAGLGFPADGMRAMLLDRPRGA